MMCGARAKFCQRNKGFFCEGSFLAQDGQRDGVTMLRGIVNAYHQGIRHVQR